jgi:hypothetical protein
MLEILKSSNQLWTSALFGTNAKLKKGSKLWRGYMTILDIYAPAECKEEVYHFAN